MTLKTLDGGETVIKQEILDGLKLSLSGLMLLPGDSGFEESRTVWNGMIDRNPAVIVKCLGNQDVINCIRFIREHNLMVCIKGGGHHIAGLATADGAFMLDMSLMRGVMVDPIKKIAHAQAGCLLSDVDRETQVHGLASVLGFVSQTGIAGLTLGGGFGYLTRRWGWTSDTVTGMSVVTAEGKLVRADYEQNTDLFWALRGGGGNFGVITEIEYNLYEAGPLVVGGIVAWQASDAPEVLGYYRKLAEQAPPELTVIALLRLAPPAPWLPTEIHGKPIVAILACYSGNTDTGEKVVAPIKAFGNPVGDILVPRPYVQLQAIVDAANPKGRRYYQKSEFLPRVEPALFEKFIHHASMMPSPFSVIMLFQVAGALNHLPGDHSPAGNRNAHFVLNIPGSWEKAEDDEKNISWVRNAWNDLKSFSTGGNYINFQAEDEGKDRLSAALGDGLQRLIEIKKKWDPENVFRLNRNIKPY
jgi:FAD/FMN-containing dehydrogenase